MSLKAVFLSSKEYNIGTSSDSFPQQEVVLILDLYFESQ